MSTIAITKTGIRSHSLTTSFQVSQLMEEILYFFADAINLEVLTPASLRFKILSPLPIAMKQGLLIDYRLSLYGIPFKGQSKITVWEPPFKFTDEQTRGPYQLWIHEHKFERVKGNSLVSDAVHYTLKRLAIIRSLVERDLKKISLYRPIKPGSVTAFAAKGSYCFFMDLYFKNPFLIPTWFFLLVKFESIFEKTGH